jgi:hypothetical protein
VQTFLPYPDFRRTAEVLDSPRLGKQRVETLQILRALELPEYGGGTTRPSGCGAATPPRWSATA